MSRRFYLSGPMRGYPKFNFPAFDAAAIAGRKRGFEIISPADMDRELGLTENDDVSVINTQENQRRFAERDCDAIFALRAENHDGIALLSGWERSTGALAEVFIGHWVGLCIVDAETWEPFTHAKMFQLSLTALIHTLRKFIGDSEYKDYEETRKSS